MARQKLLVTVDFDRVPSKAGKHVSVDVGKLVAQVPSARILSGDPNVSVKVSIEERYRGRLLAAVAAYCVVDSYADLTLY